MRAAIKAQGGCERLLKIGDVSKQSGISIESKRFYEKQRMLNQAARTESGYRLYARAVFERLHFIKRAQVLGFSLSEIAHIIKEKESGRNPCANVRQVVRERLEEMEERMKEMRRYHKELRET